MKSYWKWSEIYRLSCSGTQNFLLWPTTVAGIFKDFESNFWKKYLATPLLLNSVWFDSFWLYSFLGTEHIILNHTWHKTCKLELPNKLFDNFENMHVFVLDSKWNFIDYWGWILHKKCLCWQISYLFWVLLYYEVKKPKIWNYQLSNLGYLQINFNSCYCYFERFAWDLLHTDKSVTRH